MTVALPVARVALALVFAIAALAKLSDRAAFARTLESFGLRPRTSRVGSLALPLTELGVAALLLPASTARWAAFLAVSLLAAFCVAIARVLVRGEQVDCGCFGSARSAPVGARALARNGVLAVFALLVLGAGPGRALEIPSLPAISVQTASLGVSLLAVALSCWFSWQLLRQNGRLLERISALEESHGLREAEPHDHSGLPAGSPAPGFDLPDAQGGRRTLDELLEPGVPVALVFSDPDCGACEGLAERVEHARAAHAGSLEVALISRPTDDSGRDFAGMANVLFEREREVGTAYGVRTVPHMVVVDPSDRVIAESATGRPAVDDLLASYVDDAVIDAAAVA